MRSMTVAMLALPGLCAIGHAQEIYKWVDDKGQTHYSQTKPDAAKAVELKVPVAPPAPPAPPAPRPPAAAAGDDWLKQRFDSEGRPLAPQPPAAPAVPPKPPRSISGGRSDDTDASKCNLARDVLSGSLRHHNGAAIDAHDRQTAENDVRLFCRQ